MGKASWVPDAPGVLRSRGMAGELTAALLDEKLDVNGTSFKEASTAAGYGGSSHQVCLHPYLFYLCYALPTLGYPQKELERIPSASSV